MLGLVSAGDNTSQLSSLQRAEQRQTHCSGLPLPHFTLFLLVRLDSFWSYPAPRNISPQWTADRSKCTSNQTQSLQIHSLNNTIQIPAIVLLLESLLPLGYTHIGEEIHPSVQTYCLIVPTASTALWLGVSQP